MSTVTITASDVNKLRQETGAGIMDCKKALIETKFGCAVNLSSETDFVAKNEDFINLAKSIADVALAGRIKTLEDLQNAQLDGVTIKDKLLDTVAKIGEKIDVKKYEVVEGDGIVAYIHMGYRMGVLVQLNKALNEEISSVGKDVAMQIAAMNPVAVDASGVSDEMKTRERAIAREKAVAAGKPENILDKIADGAVNTMLKENTLLPQPFVKDGSKTVEQYLKTADKDLTVVSFKRVTLS